MKSLRALLLAVLATLAHASPPPAGIDVGWRLVGEGDMRWFGFELYRARLWTPGDGWRADGAYALELRYAREIPARRLVQASLDEMARLGADAGRLAQWRGELERVFPDVRQGEVIVGVNRPGRGAQFYHQGRPTGWVEDDDFARMFFAIWLDPRTREPALRARLLGQG
jgi:hypothetical protein